MGGTSEQKGVTRLWQTFHSLERLGGCGHSNVCSFQLFWEEAEGGVLLILLGVEIVAMRIENFCAI